MSEVPLWGSEEIHPDVFWVWDLGVGQGGRGTGSLFRTRTPPIAICLGFGASTTSPPWNRCRFRLQNGTAENQGSSRGQQTHHDVNLASRNHHGTMLGSANHNRVSNSARRQGVITVSADSSRCHQSSTTEPSRNHLGVSKSPRGQQYARGHHGVSRLKGPSRCQQTHHGVIIVASRKHHETITGSAKHHHGVSTAITVLAKQHHRFRKVDIRLPGKGKSKLPWSEAGQPNHPDEDLDSDKKVVNREVSLITVSAKRHHGVIRLAVGEAELALDDRDVEAPLFPGR